MGRVTGIKMGRKLLENMRNNLRNREMFETFQGKQKILIDASFTWDLIVLETPHNVKNLRQ